MSVGLFCFSLFFMLMFFSVCKYQWFIRCVVAFKKINIFRMTFNTLNFAQVCMSCCLFDENLEQRLSRIIKKNTSNTALIKTF